MNIISKVALSCFVFLSLVSCNNDIDKLHADIDNLHIKLMEEDMGEIKALEISIKELPDSIKNQDQAILDSEISLEKSSDWMMQWMREYKPELKEEEYLRHQLIQLNEMQKFMNQTKKDAQEILDKY